MVREAAQEVLVRFEVTVMTARSEQPTEYTENKLFSVSVLKIQVLRTLNFSVEHSLLQPSTFAVKRLNVTFK